MLNSREQLKGIEASYATYLERKKSGKKPPQGKGKKEPSKEKKDKPKKVSGGSLVSDIQGDTSGYLYF